MAYHERGSKVAISLREMSLELRTKVTMPNLGRYPCQRSAHLGGARWLLCFAGRFRSPTFESAGGPAHSKTLSR